MGRRKGKGAIATYDFALLFLCRFAYSAFFLMLTAVVAPFAVSCYGSTDAEAGVAVGVFIIAALASRLLVENMVAHFGYMGVLRVSAIGFRGFCALLASFPICGVSVCSVGKRPLFRVSFQCCFLRSRVCYSERQNRRRFWLFISFDEFGFGLWAPSWFKPVRERVVPSCFSRGCSACHSGSCSGASVDSEGKIRKIDGRQRHIGY